MIRRLGAELLPIGIAAVVGVLILTHPGAIDFRPGTLLDLIAVLVAVVTYSVTDTITERLTPSNN